MTALSERRSTTPLEVVDVIRNRADVPPVVNEAIGSQAVWPQLGVVHEAGAAKVRTAPVLAQAHGS